MLDLYLTIILCHLTVGHIFVIVAAVRRNRLTATATDQESTGLRDGCSLLWTGMETVGHEKTFNFAVCSIAS